MLYTLLLDAYNTHNGYTTKEGKIVPPIDINDFPAIKNWLDNGEWNTKPEKGSNYDRLVNRTDKGITPYNLRSLAYMDVLFNPKIVYSEIVTHPQFYFDTEGIYVPEATSFLMTGTDLDILIKYLNSEVVSWVFKTFYAGGGLGKGFRYKKAFLENTPIPMSRLSECENNKIEKEIMSLYKFNDTEIEYIKKHSK